MKTKKTILHSLPPPSILIALLLTIILNLPCYAVTQQYTIEPLPTQCPMEPTTCSQEYTVCPEQPTWCPMIYTQCPMEPTMCYQEYTMCSYEPTMCQIMPTWCPSEPTFCPQYYTECPQTPTECPVEPTICYPETTICSQETTLCPQIKTECPIVETQCPVTPECSTVITLKTFTADPGNRKVTILWNTASEIDNLGFNIYRSDAEDGEYVKINAELIAAKGSAVQGAEYQFVDNDVRNRNTYFYKLEDIDLNDISTFHGPASATPRLIFGLR